VTRQKRFATAWGTVDFAPGAALRGARAGNSSAESVTLEITRLDVCW
jgi:hypothetical protein